MGTRAGAAGTAPRAFRPSGLKARGGGVPLQSGTTGASGSGHRAQTKGKVERPTTSTRGRGWLDEVANVRVHGTLQGRRVCRISARAVAVQTQSMARAAFHRCRSPIPASRSLIPGEANPGWQRHQADKPWMAPTLPRGHPERDRGPLPQHGSAGRALGRHRRGHGGRSPRPAAPPVPSTRCSPAATPTPRYRQREYARCWPATSTTTDSAPVPPPAQSPRNCGDAGAYAPSDTARDLIRMPGGLKWDRCDRIDPLVGLCP